MQVDAYIALDLDGRWAIVRRRLSVLMASGIRVDLVVGLQAVDL